MVDLAWFMVFNATFNNIISYIDHLYSSCVFFLIVVNQLHQCCHKTNKLQPFITSSMNVNRRK